MCPDVAVGGRGATRALKTTERTDGRATGRCASLAAGSTKISEEVTPGQRPRREEVNHVCRLGRTFQDSRPLGQGPHLAHWRNNTPVWWVHDRSRDQEERQTGASSWTTL